MSKVDLSSMDLRGYSSQRPYWFRAAWIIIEALTLLNPVFVSYRLKARILRFFGASMGKSPVIKPGVHIKYPWRLSVGDYVWLGERVWIDNLADVMLGDNVCISQGAYLCTGNHDWSDPHMDLVTGPITVSSGAWIAAFAKVGPGVEIGQDAVIALGAVLVDCAEPGGVYVGNPARRIGTRTIHDADSGRHYSPHGSQPAPDDRALLAHEDTASVNPGGS
jgi:putative colanic acid biosynthesis acetyltransferase WcaF